MARPQRPHLDVPIRRLHRDREIDPVKPLRRRIANQRHLTLRERPLFPRVQHDHEIVPRHVPHRPRPDPEHHRVGALHVRRTEPVQRVPLEPHRVVPELGHRIEVPQQHEPARAAPRRARHEAQAVARPHQRVPSERPQPRLEIVAQRPLVADHALDPQQVFGQHHRIGEQQVRTGAPRGLRH